MKKSFTQLGNNSKSRTRLQDNAQKTKKLKRSKIAYLTFDDGPAPVTKQILDLLASHKVSGTFFMLEPNIRRFPALVRRMVKEGHAVGLHGVTHKINCFYSSKYSLLKELKQTSNTLKKVCGRSTVLVRTPYGSLPYLTPDLAKAVRGAGYRLWDWNVDSLDWKFQNERSVQRVKNKVRQLEKSGVQPVILLHDRKETSQFLPKIIFFLKKRGYTLKRLTPSMKPVSFV